MEETKFMSLNPIPEYGATAGGPVDLPVTRRGIYDESKARTILVWPSPTLAQVSREVTKEDIEERGEQFRNVLDAMRATMYVANGAGLAAIQIGVPLRLFMVDLDEESGGFKILVNPQLFLGEDKMRSTEGCLSVPGHYGEVERSQNVHVKYLDEDMHRQEMNCEGALAAAVQHEYDHLNGITYVERLSHLKRDLIRRSLRKQVKKSQRSKRDP